MFVHFEQRLESIEKAYELIKFLKVIKMKGQIHHWDDKNIIQSGKILENDPNEISKFTNNRELIIQHR